jgi:methylthioribose-1-phosphate isomerase
LQIETIKWVSGAVRIIDQTRLPLQLVYLDCRDVETLAQAIEELKVRGAPAIGVAATYGVVLSVWGQKDTSQELERKVRCAVDRLSHTRPTAINLFWALERMQRAFTQSRGEEPERIQHLLLQEADRIFEQERKVCQKIGENGAALLEDGMSVLTHCNAGALATAGLGTALGVIYAAKSQGKHICVFADETRPLLQGARLTAWELLQNEIEVTLICDNAAAALMRTGRIDAVLVGADRIARNGDVANKVGTYGLAVLAKEHHIPFYVAAPLSTLDMNLADGSQIPIEQRNSEEVTQGFGLQTAPPEVKVFNPAFDVTPAELVSAIISEKGIARNPYEPTFQRWVK